MPVLINTYDRDVKKPIENANFNIGASVMIDLEDDDEESKDEVLPLKKPKPTDT